MFLTDFEGLDLFYTHGMNDLQMISAILVNRFSPQILAEIAEKHVTAAICKMMRKLLR